MEVSEVAVITAFNTGDGSGGGGEVNPSGSILIEENGTYNVRDYASAEVDVPQGVFPTGTEYINENGIYNVTSYAEVSVLVEHRPTETIDIYTNGQHNVSGYLYAHVAVPPVPMTTQTAKFRNTSSGDVQIQYISGYNNNKLQKTTQTLAADATAQYTIVAGTWVIITPLSSRHINVIVATGTGLEHVAGAYNVEVLLANKAPEMPDNYVTIQSAT